MVLILISEDVLEPSYNDLKFKVWNFNYICINLIHFFSSILIKKKFFF